MTPEEVCAKAALGELPTVVLVAGDEEHLRSKVLSALREAATAGGVKGLNEDLFIAGEHGIDAILGAARTLPMLARRRFVLVRQVERWEASNDASANEAMDRVIEYAQKPAPTTVLVLAGQRLDGRRRLVTSAKKGSWLVACDPLSRGALPTWIQKRASELEATIEPSVAELLVEMVGPELSTLSDSLERLSLYVGRRGAIDEAALSDCLIRVQTSTVWELVAAVGKKDLGAALLTLQALYEPQDRGLPLVGVLAWSTRQLLRFESALRATGDPTRAAQVAGAPPFKARELATQVRALPRAELERWLVVLADLDLALKGSSRRPAKAILEHTLMKLCRSQAGAVRPKGPPRT